MQIVFKKGKEQLHSLTCRRDDGTTTWSKLKGDFGPMHDLAHYVIETSLGFERGFYGLLALGYDITSFEREEDTSWIGGEGLYVECIVMGLQYQYSGVTTVETFEQVINDATRKHDIEPWMVFSPDQINVLVSRYNQILMEWKQLPAGASMILPFPDKKSRISDNT
ncbi:MAG: hypothetical protein AB8G77_13330 [Rhodothermales bacterium]